MFLNKRMFQRMKPQPHFIGRLIWKSSSVIPPHCIIWGILDSTMVAGVHYAPSHLRFLRQHSCWMSNWWAAKVESTSEWDSLCSPGNWIARHLLPICRATGTITAPVTDTSYAPASKSHSPRHNGGQVCHTACTHLMKVLPYLYNFPRFTFCHNLVEKRKKDAQRERDVDSVAQGDSYGPCAARVKRENP